MKNCEEIDKRNPLKSLSQNHRNSWLDSTFEQDLINQAIVKKQLQIIHAKVVTASICTMLEIPLSTVLQQLSS